MLHTVYTLVGIICITMHKPFFSKVNSEDPFSSATSSTVSNVIVTKNVPEEASVKSEDIPPALPPKVGTPTRPCPPPPGMRVGTFPKSTRCFFSLSYCVGLIYRFI